jgi:hypothetical protein
MSTDDGLQQWNDGSSAAIESDPPSLGRDPQGIHLWAVRPEDVVQAEETCAFGKSLKSGVIKHTNLTGGAPANCAGELIFMDDQVIALNGASGRYGPSNKEEMTAVAKAFRESGYGVWNYGFDEEINFPFRFGSRTPEWVE